METDALTPSATTTFIAIWATIISSAVLLKTAQQYWDVFGEAVDGLKTLVLPNEASRQRQIVVGLAIILFMVPAIVVGYQSIIKYVPQSIVQIQVLLAAGSVVAWIGKHVCNTISTPDWNRTTWLCCYGGIFILWWTGFLTRKFWFPFS